MYVNGILRVTYVNVNKVKLVILVKYFENNP